jgi:hypothetical protein
MEASQKELLGRIDLSPFDRRFRRIREQTRSLFEQAWRKAIGKGTVLSEEEIASLYIHCLLREMSLNGINIPPDALPHDEKIIHLIPQGRR